MCIPFFVKAQDIDSISDYSYEYVEMFNNIPVYDIEIESEDDGAKNALLKVAVGAGNCVVYDKGISMMGIRGSVTLFGLYFTGIYCFDNYPYSKSTTPCNVMDEPNLCLLGVGYEIPIYRNVPFCKYKVFITPETDIMYKRYYYFHKIDGEAKLAKFERKFAFGTNVTFMNQQKGKFFTGATVAINTKYSGVTFVCGF